MRALSRFLRNVDAGPDVEIRLEPPYGTLVPPSAIVLAVFGHLRLFPLHRSTASHAPLDDERPEVTAFEPLAGENEPSERVRLWLFGKPYVLAAAIYLCSRLVVLLAIYLARIYLPLWNPDWWQSGPRWYDHLLRWDSEWYARIAEQG